jgi:hypothetical protein
MKTALSGLLSSKKAIITILTMVIVMVLCLAGHIDGDAALDVIKWVAMVWLGAQALVDSKAKS